MRREPRRENEMMMTYWQAQAERLRKAGCDVDRSTMSDYHARGMCDGAQAGCRACAAQGDTSEPVLRTLEDWEERARRG